jgi:hypothetical protein
MPSLEIPVDDDLAVALAREADRLGFDSRAAYVRWLLRERGAADPSTAAAATADGGARPDLSPSRVARRDEGLTDDATRLGDVHRARVDAPVGSSLADDRPGADLADLDALDLPGHDADLLERRRRLVGAAVEHLREAGEARRSEFVAALREDRPAGYGSVDGWWSCLKRGLRQVDRVRNADEGRRTWGFRDVRGRVYVSRE